jgi:RNA polymerase sigma factor (TIGR02999 family)
MNSITSILGAIERGDGSAARDLLPLVYDELRKLARQRMAHERPGQTLQATALVHEAYVRLLGSDGADGARHWDGRGHFFAAAAEAMRRILVDNARRKRRPKHGGDRKRVNLDEVAAVSQAPGDDLLALDEALSELAVLEPVKARLVELRFFGGLTIPQAAEVLGVSVATAERYWTYARVWLYCRLEEGSRPGRAKKS